MTAALPAAILDRHGRPMQAVQPLTKDQRIALTGGDLGVWIPPSKAGKRVDIDTALQLSTVYSCVGRTAQTIASLPLDLFAKTARGREVVDGDLADLIGVSPNASQTAVEFWEGMVAWLMITGNAYARIERVGQRIAALIPVPSTRIRTLRTAAGDLAYERIDERGGREVLDAGDILHLRGWGFGGDEGLSPIRWGVQSLGSALAADEAGAGVFSSGLQASGFIKMSQTMQPEQRAQVQEIFDEFSGSGRTGKMMVLEAGMDFVPLSINPDDAQMLETRRFSVEEICRWFGVPPIVIGHAADGQTMWGSGVEQILLSWLQLGINPILKKIEARIAKSLIPPARRRRWYAEFNREAMLQMDAKAKAEMMRTLVSLGIYSRDECRALLNMPRRGGAADELLAQTAMAPIDTLGKGA